MTAPWVLVTGATGFVGRRMVPVLRARGWRVRRALRRPEAVAASRDASPDESVLVGDIGPETDWRAPLRGVELVVHAAARVHQMRESAASSDAALAAHLRVNALGTKRLAEAAAAAGVRRLVFLSTVKVLGDASGPATPLTDASPPAPGDPYALAKWQAERALAEIVGSSSGRLEVVVLRPPLVYGPGVKGNFLTLLKLCSLGLPLPFGAVDNRRSLLFVDNLVDATVRCLEHAAAAGSTLLVSDGEALSTAELIRRLSAALGRTARLWPVPPSGLRALGWLTGRRAELDRLLNDLVVDDSRLRGSLAWRCPYSVDEGLTATARWYRDRASSAADAPAQ